MAFKLDQFNVMEHLWETLEKGPDGKVHYSIVDIEQLWQAGFVDTGKTDLSTWKSAFDPYRKPDGSYSLSRDEFVALDQYRYKGEIRMPFDAMMINEGRYTDEGLDELIRLSIAPSCGLESKGLNDFFDALKKDFRQKDGLILIKEPAKERIAALLSSHPSPLRNLELMVEYMISSKGEEIKKDVERGFAETASEQSRIQKSRFSQSPTSGTEEKAKKLKAIENAKRSKARAEIEGVAKVELKKIKRSRKGMRG